VIDRVGGLNSIALSGLKFDMLRNIGLVGMEIGRFGDWI
jgi:hypothetical protein